MTIIETGATAPDLGGLIVGRLNRMASGDPKWDLSPTDRAAIKVVVAALGALELEREALSAQNAALKGGAHGLSLPADLIKEVVRG